MLNVDDAAICLDCTTRIKDKAIMPSKVEFYQVWSHSLSVDCAKSVTQKTIPGDALFFYIRDFNAGNLLVSGLNTPNMLFI